MALPKRKAVTLIELLVVISIIGILIGLATYGVMVVRGRDQNATANIEMSEFRAALERFKALYGAYPPSQITISNATVDDQLKRIWPSIASDAFKNWPGITNQTLQGDQCLVLFLGGYQANGLCYGFSQSKVYPFSAPVPPTANASAEPREQPLFKFKGPRMIQRNSSPFYSYADPFNSAPGPGSTCYAYFCPTQKGYDDGTVNAVVNHCNTMLDPASNFARPFKDAANSYLNRGSYQIISAGKNGLWGGARQWAQGTGIIDSGNDPNGASADNITNFAGGLLSGD